MTSAPQLQVCAIVPYSGYGSDEILALVDDDRYCLPCGSLEVGERVLEAAERIVLETTGLPVTSERLVYLLETAGGDIVFGVLCAPGEPADVEGDLRGEIVSLAGVIDRFEPAASGEVLMEDLRSGFVRPVAHLVERLEGGTPVVSVTW